MSRRATADFSRVDAAHTDRRANRARPVAMSAATQLHSWGEALLGFVYPQVCQFCGGQRATVDEGYVCSRCWQGVRFLKPPFCARCGLPFEGAITTPFECANCREMDLHFRFARAAVAAEGLVLEAIHRYKYQRALWLEPFLTDLLVRAAKPELGREEWDLIVPVPLHPAKKREREFNQAERIAACLGKTLQIPVSNQTLRRIEPTRTQTQLTREQRAANVQQAFALQADAQIKDLRVILVDDVLTTGATTSACARVLRQAGAADVCVWTVARGL
jgi:ComF family protein